MTIDRRIFIAAGAVLAVLVLAVGGFLLGRSTTGDDAPNAVATVNGVTIGTDPSRAGALAAADNYVATAVDEILASPDEYEKFVREAFQAQSVSEALEAARGLREELPNTVAAFADGMHTTTWPAARKLVSYGNGRAQVLTWTGSTNWGGKNPPKQSWALNRTTLVWEREGWRIQKMQADPADAPAPATVRVQGTGDTNETFEILDDMTAPIYGVG
jgi:hypothetical protein